MALLGIILPVCYCRSVLLFAPRAPVEQASTARGARNFVPKKVRLREEPLHPQPRCAHLCPYRKIDGLPPQRPPTRPPPASAVHRLLPKKPKCEKRLAASHPSPPAHIAARDERRRSPAERTSALRSLLAPRACRCSFSQSKLKDMQQQRPRVPAASHHLSANADSTVFLLGFRRSYLFTATLHHHHRLRQRSGRHANVVCGILSLA